MAQSFTPLPRRSLAPLLWLATLPALVVGCSGSDDADSSSGGLTAGTAQGLEGIYQITDHTEDATGCGVGPLIADGPAYLVAVAGEVFGIQTLTVVSCVDEAECAAFAQAIRDLSPYGGFELSYTLTEEESPTALSGFEATTGFGNDAGMCTERTYESIAMSADGAGTITIDAELFALPDAPQDADGFCMVEPAKSRSEAEGAACTGHVSVTATRLGDV